MPNWEKKRGKYRVELSGEFGKRIHSFEFEQKLNEESELRVRVSIPMGKNGSVRADAFPQECQLKWGDKVVARGTLSRSHDEFRQITLVYSCSVRKLKSISSNLLYLEKSLKKLIGELCATAGVNAKFHGDFSQSVTSLSLEGKTHHQVLCDLGSKFGFVFSSTNRGDVSFIRVGNHVNTESLSGKEIQAIQGVRQSGFGYESLSIRYVDSASTDPQDAQVAGAEARSVLGDFAKHSGYGVKSRWTQPKMSIAVRDRAHFESAKSILKYQVAQRLLMQERTSVSSLEHIASVGDKVRLEKTHLSGLQEGDYFLAALRVNGRSNLPTAIYELCRA